jgi:hypothetical protein
MVFGLGHLILHKSLVTKKEHWLLNVIFLVCIILKSWIPKIKETTSNSTWYL